MCGVLTTLAMKQLLLGCGMLTLEYGMFSLGCMVFTLECGMLNLECGMLARPRDSQHNHVESAVCLL